MEQGQGQPAQLPNAPFPAPPPFWKHFTLENKERLAAVENDNTESKPLPIELTFLKPPPPPAESASSFTVFSIPQSLSAVPAPPPSELLLFDPESTTFNPANVLTRLTRSLLLNFLELATVLSNDPTQYAEKLTDVNRLMLNVHFVINMYRPHQAREGVKEMLEKRLDEGKAEIEKCDQMMARVKAFLQTLGQESYPNGATDHGINTHDHNEDTTKLWELIENMKAD